MVNLEEILKWYNENANAVVDINKLQQLVSCIGEEKTEDWGIDDFNDFVLVSNGKTYNTNNGKFIVRPQYIKQQVTPKLTQQRVLPNKQKHKFKLVKGLNNKLRLIKDN